MNTCTDSTPADAAATLSPRLHSAILELRAAVMAEDANVKGVWVSYEDYDVVGRFILSGLVIDRSSGRAMAIGPADAQREDWRMSDMFIGKHLFDAVVEGYDEIQKAALLVRGADLALYTAEDKEARYAVPEILHAALSKLAVIGKAIEAANEADIAQYARRVQ